MHTKFLYLIFLLTSLAAFAEPMTLNIVGATIYDGTGAGKLENGEISIQSGVISCIGQKGTCNVNDKTAKTVDFSGKYITPGLVDSHVHFSQTGWLDGRPTSGIGLDVYDYDVILKNLQNKPKRWHNAYLCSGITAVFDVGGHSWTTLIEDGSRISTTTVHHSSAGPLLTNFEPAAKRLEHFWFINSKKSAINAVIKLHNLGASAVKLILIGLDSEEYKLWQSFIQEISKEASRLNMRVVVHATKLEEAKMAIRGGTNVLVHSVDDHLVDDEFIQIAKDNKVVYTPTLLAKSNWAKARTLAGLGIPLSNIDDPNKCIDSQTLNLFKDGPRLQASMPEKQTDVSYLLDQIMFEGKRLELMKVNLRTIYKAGITIATATDAGNPLTPHGPSIYAEMEAMQEAGLTPEDIIVMSTRNGTIAMGRSSEFGTLQKDKAANLIVLTKDPSKTVSAFRSITHVVKSGKLHPVSKFGRQD